MGILIRTQSMRGIRALLFLLCLAGRAEARTSLTSDLIAKYEVGTPYAQFLTEMGLEADKLEQRPGPKGWVQGWFHLPEGDLYVVAAQDPAKGELLLARVPLFLTPEDLRKIGSRPVILDDVSDRFKSGDSYPDTLAKLGLKKSDLHPEPNMPPDLLAGRFFLPEGDLFLSAEKKKDGWVLESPPWISRSSRELSDSHAAMAAAILRTRDAPVPLPKTTPYDNDPDARRVYIDTFQNGYRRGLAGVFSTLCGVKWKYMRAEQQGWLDGQIQVMRTHPEILLPPAEPSADSK